MSGVSSLMVLNCTNKICNAQYAIWPICHLQYTICNNALYYINKLGLILCIYYNMTIILCQAWPADALQAVATRSLGELDIDEDIKTACIEMCKEFHTSTRDLSVKFEAELERHNYVTPTSYLELIATFKTMITQKRT